MMKSFRLFQTCLATILSSLLCSMPLTLTASSSPRAELSLEGVWDFSTDPENVGEKEEWFKTGKSLPGIMPPGSTPEVPGKIRVPGPWERYGYGSENPKVKHQYLGKGWYKKESKIPASWKGKKIFLKIGGAHRYAKTWVNNVYLGEHIGPLSKFEYDITAHVEAGKMATIAIQVDSKQRWEIDGLYGCYNLGIDYMREEDFSGLWGHVGLEARSDVYLDELYLHSKVFPSPKVTVEAQIIGKHLPGDHLQVEILEGTQVCAKRSPIPLENNTLKIDIDFPEAKLWSPEHPYLYTARLSLIRAEKVVDAVEDRIGIREIEIRGIYFFLNGKRLFLRGLGENEIYRDEVAMATDKNVHLKRYKLARSYGFNFVRLHSSIMPEEYYEACDELGMLVGGEFAIAYSGVYKRASAPAARETYNREWREAIKRYRNHPSIMYWCMGNELRGHLAQASQFKSIANELDPARHFIDTDGAIIAKDYSRETLDFLVKFFNDGTTESIGKPDKFGAAQDYPKPIISHESGNYVTFPRFEQMKKFTGIFKPWWLIEAKEKLSNRFSAQELQQWAENSEKLYLLLHKSNIETHRKNSFMSGYHLWTFQEHLNLSVGIVDHAYEPKGILTPDKFLPFNDSVIIVEDGLELSYRDSDTLKTEFKISNYSEDSVEGDFSWKILLGGKQIHHEKPAFMKIPQGELLSAGKAELTLPQLETPKQIVIQVTFDKNGKKISNEWKRTVFPSTRKTVSLTKPLFVEEEFLPLLSHLGAKKLTDATETNAIYVTAKPTTQLLDAVDKGATLIILSWENLTFPTANTRFKTTWWRGKDGGIDKRNNYGVGTVMYPHIVTRDMAPEGWGDISWYRLLEGAQGYLLDNFPSKPEVIIRGIEGFEMSRDKALLFQANAGKGAVLVSGLNHKAALHDPGNEWLISQLVHYAVTPMDIKAKLPMDFLKAACKEPSAQPK